MDETAAADGAIAGLVLAARRAGLRDRAILAALESVPRAVFAEAEHARHAHADVALPLPCGQVMTAPLDVAATVSALSIVPDAQVLEIGTGSCYQAALMAALGAVVLSYERYNGLAIRAQSRLAARPMRVTVRHGDGLAVVPDRLFDRIVLNGAVPEVPRSFLAALAPDGILLAPVDDGTGPLLRLFRRMQGDGLERLSLGRCQIAPLISGVAAVL
jgi:protein-L-isoaspartate(D-aspartate) O-methyltransferase